MMIETDFDAPLEEDIVLEETDQTIDYKDVLKNTENLLKSYLYIKKLVNSSSPTINAFVKATSIDTSSATEEYAIDSETGMILIKNTDTVKNYSIFINDGEFILFPYESLEIPTAGVEKLETNGTFSIMESKFGI